MSEICSKLCQISRMMRHNENPGKVRTFFSGIFRYSARLSHVQAYSGTLRHIEAY